MGNFPMGFNIEKLKVCILKLSQNVFSAWRIEDNDEEERCINAQEGGNDLT